MHFLNQLDELKVKYISENNIGYGSQFYYYKDIEFEKKLCDKINNENILISNSDTEIKVYLADYDIITILIGLLNKHTIHGNLIIDELIKFIENKTNEYSFKIDEYPFVANGIPIINGIDISLSTKADFKISINEFITLSA